MKNVFAYLELATGAIGAVGVLQHLVAGAAPVQGAQLVAAVGPVIFAIQEIFPKLTVPMDLVTEIASGAAAAINAHYKKVQA